jgi:hypothetical protein
MPLAVGDPETLKMYLDGVMNRSEHHAKTVGAIALALIGAILWKKDAAPIEVKTYDGKPANILWVHIGGRKYALAYNHEDKCIELRDRTLTGKAVFNFTNKTPVTDVYKVFGSLYPSCDETYHRSGSLTRHREQTRSSPGKRANRRS